MVKKIYYIFFSSIFVTIPFFVEAQLEKPDSYGLVHNDSFVGVLEGVVSWVLGILASLSILVIVVSGIIYVTSGGDQGRIDTAKKMLTYAIVGLVVALLGYVIMYSVASALGAG